jgi:hypothetical protein
MVPKCPRIANDEKRTGTSLRSQIDQSTVQVAPWLSVERKGSFFCHGFTGTWLRGPTCTWASCRAASRTGPVDGIVAQGEALHHPPAAIRFPNPVYQLAR